MNYLQLLQLSAPGDYAKPRVFQPLGAGQYRRGIPHHRQGLLLIAAGAFWFIPATSIGTYWAFLTGLFILAAIGFCPNR